MEWCASEDLIAMAIGRTAMMSLNYDRMIEAVDSVAMDLVEEILELLNDHMLDDWECFHEIDSIVSAFRQRGIDVYRHDFG